MKKFLFLALMLANPAFAADVWDYKVTASKLDNSRNNLSPKTGGSAYSFTKKDLDNLPQGQATSLNQVLLRAPGVTQDSYGQLHVRNDHSNLQYRINDVIIPEGINGFGQTLDTHFADSIELLTGALPAQYGYRTAGVVDIKTKSGAFNKGAYSEVMVGGNNTTGVNQQISGSSGKLNYFVSATYLQNSRGIEPPTSARNAIHDDTKQDKLFGYFSYLLDAQTRLSVIVANADNRFQVPNNPNQDPQFTFSDGSFVSSQNLNEKQKESNRYAIMSLQGATDSNLDYQVSLFTRQSDLIFRGDNVGDLIYSGVASDIDRTSFVNGLQGDLSKELNEKNTLRFGFYASDTAVKNDQANDVFAAVGGTQTGFVPFRINDGTKKHVRLFSLYLQDELKPIEKLTINFGARFDVAQGYVDEHQISPRVGAIYQLNKETKLHAGFSRYFTPPKAELISSEDVTRFQNTTNEPENFVNDKVRAERSSYYDAGISHKLTSHTTLGLDAYYRDVKNLLDEGQFGTALIFKPFNYQKAKIYGVEFTADYRRENLSAFINIAAQKAKARQIISGQYLFENDELDYISNNYVNPDHSQKMTASAGVSYLFSGTRYAADGIFGSGLRKGFANTESLPFYSQFNISAARDVEKFNVRLAMVNLFDKSYKLRDGSGIGVGAPQFGPRRTVYLIVSKSF